MLGGDPPPVRHQFGPPIRHSHPQMTAQALDPAEPGRSPPSKLPPAGAGKVCEIFLKFPARSAGSGAQRRSQPTRESPLGRPIRAPSAGTRRPGLRALWDEAHTLLPRRLSPGPLGRRPLLVTAVYSVTLVEVVLVHSTTVPESVGRNSKSPIPSAAGETLTRGLWDKPTPE